MRERLFALAIAGTIAVPATAGATEYWGGPMGGGDLPAANITYKVNDEGKVRNVGIQVRVKCRAKGGGPHPNSRLITGWPRVKATDAGFEAKKRNLFSGGRQKVRGFTASVPHTGEFESRFRITNSPRGDRICHTGSQQWEAAPMTRKAWLRMRDYG